MKKLILKYKSLSLPVKVTLWYTFCNVLQRGISIITGPIFTRVLSTEQYGTYSLYLSWLNIISIFTCLNLYYGVFNKAMVKFEHDKDRYIASMQGLTITLTVIYFCIYLLFRKKFNEFFGLSTVVMLMMFIEMLVTPTLQFWSGRQRFEYKYRKLVIISVTKTISNPILGVIGVLISTNKTEARILATVIVEVFVCGILMIYQFVKGKTFFDKKYWKYAVLFNLPLIPHYLSGSLLNQGDRIVIQKLESTTSVAMYSVGNSVGMLTQLVTNAISQAVTPWLYTCLKTRKYENINRRLDFLMILVGSGCLLLMLMAPEVVWLFASQKYRDSVYVIPPLAASVFFVYVYNIYSNFEFYFEKRIFITVASVISAIANIILNLIFVPIFGYVAAGYTTLFCYLVYAFAHFFVSYCICEKELNGRQIFQCKCLIVMSVIMVVSCGIVSMLYRNVLIRYMFILMLLVVVLIMRKKIGVLVKDEVINRSFLYNSNIGNSKKEG